MLQRQARLLPDLRHGQKPAAPTPRRAAPPCPAELSGGAFTPDPCWRLLRTMSMEHTAMATQSRVNCEATFKKCLTNQCAQFPEGGEDRKSCDMSANMHTLTAGMYETLPHTFSSTSTYHAPARPRHPQSVLCTTLRPMPCTTQHAPAVLERAVDAHHPCRAATHPCRAFGGAQSACTKYNQQQFVQPFTSLLACPRM